jgi:hypothetical protein
MPEITIAPVGPNRFRVTVADGASATTHTVTVDPDLGLVDAAAEELVAASFRFLLDREPKESILREFDLGVISRYFPDYASRIGDYLG